MKTFEIKQISVLSQMDETMNFGDNVLLRKNAIANNPYREDLDADIYSKYLDVYAKVATFYINFFVCYWYKDYVEKTNEKMIAEMEKVALKTGKILQIGQVLRFKSEYIFLKEVLPLQ